MYKIHFLIQRGSTCHSFVTTLKISRQEGSPGGHCVHMITTNSV